MLGIRRQDNAGRTLESSFLNNLAACMILKNHLYAAEKISTESLANYDDYKPISNYDPAVDVYDCLFASKDNEDELNALRAMSRRATVRFQLKEYDKANDDFRLF